jgi:hypothetical protein
MKYSVGDFNHRHGATGRRPRRRHNRVAEVIVRSVVGAGTSAPNLVSLDELMRLVWPGIVVSPETVSQRIKLLRDALGDDPPEPRYVAGLRGRGYQMIAAVKKLDARTDYYEDGTRWIADSKLISSAAWRRVSPDSIKGGEMKLLCDWQPQ